MHRGRDPFSWAPGQHSEIVDVRRTKKAHLGSVDAETFAMSMRHALRHVVATAISQAGLELDSSRVRYLALPRVGRKVVGDVYFPSLQGLTRAEIVYLGDGTGHLGAGDTLANLHDLLARDDHDPGDIGLFVCAGGGFTVSCVAVRLGVPASTHPSHVVDRDEKAGAPS